MKHPNVDLALARKEAREAQAQRARYAEAEAKRETARAREFLQQQQRVDWQPLSRSPRQAELVTAGVICLAVAVVLTLLAVFGGAQ